MVCDICGKEKTNIGHCVCVDCYTTKKQDQIAKLKQQLAEKDKELKRQLKENKRLNKNFDLSRNARIRYTNKLKEQLAEKDKLIEELKEQAEIWHKLLFEKMETQIVGVTNEKLKEIRHQVCEEIREKTQYFDDCWRIKEILDQIEKGKSK